MLYLYHGNTSVCAIKVRLILEEKSLDWSGEVLDLRAWPARRNSFHNGMITGAGI